MVALGRSGAARPAITKMCRGVRSKKGVYRLIFDDECTAILYVWDAGENYWPTPQGGTGSDRADPFSEASGVDLFEANSMAFGDAARLHYKQTNDDEM